MKGMILKMEEKIKEELDKISNDFYIDDDTLLKISNDFYVDMAEKRMLKMLRSYICLGETSISSNEYLAIDIGGTNIRVCKFSVFNNDIRLDKMIKFPLKTLFRNYTTKKYSLKDLFVISLKKIKPFLIKNKKYFLGVTISFGMGASSEVDAQIIELSKGFNLRNTVNQNIKDILSEAIYELRLNIEPKVIMNDSVATLVTGNFYDSNVDIAMIVGTGHNAAFLNMDNEVINIESANFNKNICLTEFDKEYIKSTIGENDKLLEMLVGGKYIGEIANLIANKLVNIGLMKKGKKIDTKILVDVLNGDKNMREWEIVKNIGEILFKRSARLIAAEIFAIIKFTDENMDRKHAVVFDGSVYEKCEFFRNEITEALNVVFCQNVQHSIIKDASIVGPAIIAAKNI